MKSMDNIFNHTRKIKLKIRPKERERLRARASEDPVLVASFLHF